MKDNISALDAQFEAQKIAFAPVIFQVVMAMRKFGILKLLQEHKEGLDIEKIALKSGLSEYGTKVLLESALSASVIFMEEDRYHLGKIGYFLENDPMIKVNMDFNHYVNYKGLYDLDIAILEQKPAGLKVFGEDWKTIYPYLTSLPPKAQKAWFDFDHYYSDSAFEEAIEKLMIYHPRRILDIGGNTGKFSIQCANRSDEVTLTILDLPEQIDAARNNIEKHGVEKQVSFYPLNILDHTQPIPKGYDAIWMSQFLDCFGEKDIVSILKRVRKSMDVHTRVFILEPLWDKQRFEASSFAIANTSPYFTAMANGCSKMFNSTDLYHYIQTAGLQVEKTYNEVGFSHTLLVCTIDKEREE